MKQRACLYECSPTTGEIILKTDTHISDELVAEFDRLAWLGKSVAIGYSNDYDAGYPYRTKDYFDNYNEYCRSVMEVKS